MSLFVRLRRRFAPVDALSDEQREHALAWWHRSGIGIQTMESLAAGAILTALALSLGASNVYVGLLAAAPHIAQLAQVPGVYLADRYRNRRLITVLCTGFSRPMYLLMALAALIARPEAALAVLLIAVLLRHLITGLSSCSWNSWVRDLVPEARRGRLVGRRLRTMTLVGAALGLAAAGFVDLWRVYLGAGSTTVYALLFIAAFAAGSYATYCMTRIPETRMAENTGDERLLRRLMVPFQDNNYRQLLAFMGSWNFAVNLAAPFFTVHMLKRLELELSLVIGFTLLSQIVNVAALRPWGAIADRMSNKSVLLVCAPLFVSCIFAWTFTTLPEPHAGTIPLLIVIHVLTGIATAGITLASGNMAMKLAPPGVGTAYLATSSLVNSLAAGTAPVLGGLLADFFIGRELALALHWRAPGRDIAFDTLSISQWDFFFALAAITGILAITRLRRVHEVGGHSDSGVLAEFYLEARRLVQDISSVAGLHQETEFPFSRTGASARKAPRKQPTDRQ